MAKRNSVEVAINAKDNASSVFRGVAGNIQGIGNAALAISGAALVGATTGMIALGVAATNTFADFEKGMNEVFTLLPGISEAAMRQMENQLTQFDNAVGRTSDETIPALYQALSAGVPQDNVFEFLELANQAAVGGATDLETAVDGITSVVNAYGDELINATQASDLMFTAVRLGKTNFEELSASLFNVVPNAAALGVSFGDVTAAIATITAQGVPTSVATTQMRQAFVELGDAGSDVSEIFTQVAGESFKDFIAGGGSVADAMGLLETEAATLGIGINEMFGSVEAGNAALSLTGAGMESFISNTEDMNNAAGATQGAFDTMNQGITLAMNRLKARWESTLIAIGRVIAPVLTPAINAISDFVGLVSNAFADLSNSLDPNNPSSFFGMMASGASVFDATFTVASRFFAMLGFSEGFVTSIATAFGAVVNAVQTFNLSIEHGMSPVNALFQALATLAGRLTGSWEVAAQFHLILLGLKDTVMSVIDPIVKWFTENVKLEDVLIALGIAIASVVIPAIVSLAIAFAPIIITFGLLVAGIAMFRNAWETDWLGIRTTLTDVWENTLKPAFDRFGAWLSGEGIDSSGLVTVFETVSSWIIDTGIPAIATFVAWFLDNLPLAWNTAVLIWDNVLKPAWDGMVSFINDTLLPALGSMYDWFVTTGLPAIQSFIEDDFMPVWNTLAVLMGEIWVALEPVFAAFETGFNLVFGSIKTFLENDAANAWNGFTTLISGIWPLVQSGVFALRDGIKAAIDVIVVAINGAITAFDNLQNLLSQSAGGYQQAGNVTGQIGAGLASGQYSPGQVFGAFGNALGIGGNQFGGAVTAGVPTIVGESGQELFIPQQNGQIANNQDTTTALGGGGGQGVNITMVFERGISDEEAKDSAYKLKRELTASGFNITGA